MEQYLLFAIVGLGFGCINAAVAMGVIITYRGTGIINFATGAMAMWGAYVFDELNRTGDLVLPVAVVPHRVALGDGAGGVPFTVSMVLGVLSCALIGLMVHFAVFRPLRRAPILARVVASVGVLLAIQSLIVMQFSSTPRAVNAILPNEPVSLGGISFSRDRLWLTAVVVIVAVALWAWFRYTRIGLATRASAENERAIALARYSPQVLAGTTWVLSSTVVGFLVILTAPTAILNSMTYVLAIVPALAAAIVGRFSSIAVTVAAALGLGMFQSIVGFQTSKSWWPDWAVTGLSDAVPFVVIVIALFAVGDALPSRGAVEADPLPEVYRPKMRLAVIAPVVVAAGAAALLTSGSYRFGLISSMIVTIIMLSLLVLTGLVGQISLAQAGIAGTAGFALSKLGDAAGIPFPVSTLLAALAATAFGVLVGIPALRIRGAQLAVVTLAGAVALERFIFRNRSFTAPSGNPVGDPTLFGLDLGIREGRNIARVEFALLVLVVVTLCALAVGNIARSATGRRFLAVRSNERAGASVGISIANTKLLAFAIASFLAGVGGSFIGYSRGSISADSFAVLTGLSFLAFAYLGGITTVSGAVIGGLFAPLGIGFVVLDRAFDFGTAYQLLVGIGLVLTAIFNPEGIAGANRKNFERFKAIRAARKATRTADEDAAPPEIQAPAGEGAGSPHRAAGRDRPTFEDAPVVLAVDGLTVRYGGLKAVDEASLRVREGEIVGLIGPNGAGKTTIIDALTGFVPSEGRIVLDGRELVGELPYQRARMGLSRTWQSLELFGDLTVRENVQVAEERATVRSVLTDFVVPMRQVELARVDAALELAGLSNDAESRPNSLPLGRQKLVGVARALAGSPRVMLADEPAAGLDTSESRALGREFIDVAESGVSILLIDHDMGLVLEICDYIYVLDFGQMIAEGAPDEIRANEAVIDAYLGAGARP